MPRLLKVSRLLPALIFSVIIACAAYAQHEQTRLDVPYVPTPPTVVKRMLELAKVGKDDFVIDLGSGDGRIAIAAAKDFGARSLGVDIDPQRILEANENASKAGITDRVTFRQQNLFETEIKDANAITMYLLSSVNLQIRPRLLDELRPGTQLVSHAFGMAAWQPDVHEKVDNRDVYLWIVPAKAAGQWRVKDGSRSFTMQFLQSLPGTQWRRVDRRPFGTARQRKAERREHRLHARNSRANRRFSRVRSPATRWRQATARSRPSATGVPRAPPSRATGRTDRPVRA